MDANDQEEMGASGQFKIDYIQSPSGERIPFVEPFPGQQQASAGT